MAEVISLAQARAQRDPHWSGTCICIGCRHEWEGVGPLPMPTYNMECPECGAHKGTVKYPFGAEQGDLVLTCGNCDGDVITAYMRDSRLYVRCMACANDMTNAFFDV